MVSSVVFISPRISLLNGMRIRWDLRKSGYQILCPTKSDPVLGRHLDFELVHKGSKNLPVQVAYGHFNFWVAARLISLEILTPNRLEKLAAVKYMLPNEKDYNSVVIHCPNSEYNLYTNLSKGQIKPQTREVEIARLLSRIRLVPGASTN